MRATHRTLPVFLALLIPLPALAARPTPAPEPTFTAIYQQVLFKNYEENHQPYAEQLYIKPEPSELNEILAAWHPHALLPVHALPGFMIASIRLFPLDEKSNYAALTAYPPDISVQQSDKTYHQWIVEDMPLSAVDEVRIRFENAVGQWYWLRISVYDAKDVWIAALLEEKPIRTAENGLAIYAGVSAYFTLCYGLDTRTPGDSVLLYEVSTNTVDATAFTLAPVLEGMIAP